MTGGKPSQGVLLLGVVAVSDFVLYWEAQATDWRGKSPGAYS